jgi:DNA-binding response OmpR family regulator
MTQPEHSQAPANSGCVVVIDDNDALRQMLSLALETVGFDVVGARTQLDLQRVLAHNRPDALVIDLQRSEADGLDLLLRLRARQSMSDVPIVFLSGSEADDFRHQAMASGADWFGLRPLGMIELQNRVAELVRHGRAAAHPAPAKRAPRIVNLKRTG